MHNASFILSNHAPFLSHTPSDFSHSHSFTPICKINNAKYLQIQSKNPPSVMKACQHTAFIVCKLKELHKNEAQ